MRFPENKTSGWGVCLKRWAAGRSPGLLRLSLLSPQTSCDSVLQNRQRAIYLCLADSKGRREPEPPAEARQLDNVHMQPEFEAALRDRAGKLRCGRFCFPVA